MEKNKFLKKVLGIAVPVSLQSMLQSSFAMIDQMMVGQLGSTAVAAVEVAGRPTFIYSVIVGAVASIAGIMISQYLGMNDDEMVDKSLSVNLGAVTALAVMFTLLCTRLPGQIVGIYIKEEEGILKEGSDYLVRTAWTYCPMGISSILSVMIRCMEQAVWPLYAGIGAALVNTVLNYGLIFGRLGLPELGVSGAATASVISQFLNFFVILAMFVRLRAGRKEGFHFSMSLGREGYRQYLVMLLPILINEFLWSVGQNVNTFIYGHLERGDLAAMSMTGPVQGLFVGALQGVSQAAGILMGKRLGAGEYEKAYDESKKLMWYGLAGSVFLSGILIWVRGFYVQLYQVETDVQRTSAGLLFMFALLAPVKVANMILGGGIIRSGGNTTYTMVIDIIGTWLVGVPLGLVTAFVFHLPVVWVYFILSQEEVVRLLISFVVFKKKKWIARI